MGSQTAAWKFTGVRTLSVLGWRISLRSLTLLAVISWLVLVLTVLAGALFILRLIRDAFAVAGTGPVAVLIVSLGVCLYLAIGAWAREAFSSRRFAVRFSPNRDLYRAVDVNMHHVFMAEAVPKAALLFGLSGAVSAAALTAIHEGGREIPLVYAVLWFLPLLVTASWLALSSRLAAVDPIQRTPGRKVAIWVFAFVVTGLPGVAMGRVLTGLIAGNAVPGFVFPAGWEGWVWVVPAAGIAFIALAVFASANLRSVKNGSFPVTSRVPGASASLQKVPSGYPHRLFGKFLVTNIIKEKSFSLFTGIGLCLLLVAALVLGLRIGGVGPAFFGTLQGIPAVAALVVFMVSLVGSELMSKANNPAGLLPQLRYAWEAGVPAASLVWAVVLTQALPLTVLAAPTLSTMVWAMTDSLPVSLVFIPWSIATASIIGNTFSRVLAKQADGSMETSLAAAFISVVLAVPTLGLCLLEGPYPSIAAGFYAALLTGGAHQCLQRRILSRR
jgi:hypothetical protein